MRKVEPLIPGSHVYQLPQNVKSIDSLSELERMDYGMASLSYKWHWMHAGYVPLPQQKKFHDMTVPFGAFIGGVGSGKSTSGAAEVVKLALEYPGLITIVGAPTYKMLAQATLPKLREFLQPEAIAIERKDESFMQLTNTSHFWFRSTEDPNTIRGIDAGAIWLDEGGFSTDESWRVLVGRLRQNNTPYSVIKRKGLLTTTPKGMNWVWERFDGPNKSDLYAYVNCSSRMNTYLPKDYITGLEASYAGIFAKQEIEGLFVGFEGLVYPTFTRTQHVGRFRPTTPQEASEFREKAWRIFYLHDWGYTNPAVILACGVDGDGRMYILEEWYEKQRVLEDIIFVCRQMEERWGSGLHVCDPAEPGIMASLAKQGFNVTASNNAILEGISVVAARLEELKDGKCRLYVDESCVNTIMEFQNYRYPERKEEKPVKEKPLKIFDHAMDSIRYGAMYLMTPGGFTMIQVDELDAII